jgi:sulfhydrogenase subunit beta (sulfur reductase)
LKKWSVPVESLNNNRLHRQDKSAPKQEEFKLLTVRGRGDQISRWCDQMGETYTIRIAEFQKLINGLRRRGYRCIGPLPQQGAVIYAELLTKDLLPLGIIDRQSPGCYRLQNTPVPAVFGAHPGPVSWKTFLWPDFVPIFDALRTADGFEIRSAAVPPEKYAFIGVRPCDLHAIETLDLVFHKRPGLAIDYTCRRKNLFVVAVNCTSAADTCFCEAMGTGPEALSGYDLCLTELPDPVDHRFLIAVGSAEGMNLVGELKNQSATLSDLQKVRGLLSDTVKKMAGKLNIADVKDLLSGLWDHPHWSEIAARCLACGNCTMVCPTCFCTTVADTSDLAGRRAKRYRRWDSCFNLSFSTLHGGYVRSSIAARYRHFVIHKLATWVDQFGRPGCVGCGRCTTWCPAGIDITAVVGTIRQMSEVTGTKKEQGYVLNQ